MINLGNSTQVPHNRDLINRSEWLVVTWTILDGAVQARKR